MENLLAKFLEYHNGLVKKGHASPFSRMERITLEYFVDWAKDEIEVEHQQKDSADVCKDCGCCVSTNELNNVDTDHICPNCNQSLEGNECSYCGYDLGSDFE